MPEEGLRQERDTKHRNGADNEQWFETIVQGVCFILVTGRRKVRSGQVDHDSTPFSVLPLRDFLTLVCAA